MHYVLYHKDCEDGFGAAWVAWQALGEAAQYRAVNHGEPVPEMLDGSTVTMVDFAFPRDITLALKQRMGEVTILDHHETAARELAGLDFVTLDMDKSGAMLAWEHWFPGQPAPALIEYIQDKDLWLFKLPQSREVTAALQSYPKDFLVWDALDVDDLTKEGVAILRAKEQLVDRHVANTSLREVGGYLVPTVNAVIHQSEIGNRLNELYPGHPFAALYFDLADGNRKWSLRSRGEFNVAELAERFGGGGHKNAAGFTEELVSDRKGDEQ